MNSGKPAAYDQNFQLTERRVMKSYSGRGGRDKGPALRGLTEILETTFLIIDNNFSFFSDDQIIHRLQRSFYLLIAHLY